MKLTKLLILALGVMALTAAASYADVAFNTFASQRNVAVNAQTGEVDIVKLVSATGNLADPQVFPATRSIFYTFSQPITALSDIDVDMQLAGLLFNDGDAYLNNGPITQYGVWYDIYRQALIGPDYKIAEIRVGYNGNDPSPQVVQIHFTEDVNFYEGDTIKLSGVRCNMQGLSELDQVFVTLSNPEGDIAFDNSFLPVARLHDPIECEDCEPTITFRQDGKSYQDTATGTVGELFTNAFEAPEDIRIDISNIPTGFVFSGCTGVSVSGSAEIAAYCTTSGNSVIIHITASNESYFETVSYGLQFDLVATPDFEQDPAVLTIYKYPDVAGCPIPWYGQGASPCAGQTPLKYAYMPITCYVDFDVTSDIGGRLLSVFNVWDSSWDTGFGIMNGSGAEPLKSKYIWGSWWDVPQNGVVAVWLYPMYTIDSNDPFGFGTGGGPYTFTTSSATANLGYGLDLDGRVDNKSTWAVLLSQLCSVARLDTTMDGLANGTGVLCSTTYPTNTMPFEGFVIFETYFPSAEGINYVTDWSTVAQGYPMINLIRREGEDKAQRQIDKIWDKLDRHRRF